MKSGDFFTLAVIGGMALLAVGFLVLNLVRPRIQPMESQKNLLASVLSVLGVFSFLIGVWLLINDSGKQSQVGANLAIGGFAGAVLSIILNAISARSRRKSWPIAQARCVERRLEKSRFGSLTHVWSWRLVCVVEFAGTNNRVIPKVRWSDTGQSESPFWSEAKAHSFIEKAIAPSGQCKLRINPKNPLETELVS